MNNALPINCPSCAQALIVAELSCPNCETRILGAYPLPVLLQLTADEQEFVLAFFMSSGSLKEIARQIGKSYPTVRNKLDDLIAKISILQGGVPKGI